MSTRIFLNSLRKTILKDTKLFVHVVLNDPFKREQDQIISKILEVKKYKLIFSDYERCVNDNHIIKKYNYYIKPKK